MDLLRRLAHDRGRAVVIVTHDSRVFDYADRIVQSRTAAFAKARTRCQR